MAKRNWTPTLKRGVKICSVSGEETGTVTAIKQGACAARCAGVTVQIRWEDGESTICSCRLKALTPQTWQIVTTPVALAPRYETAEELIQRMEVEREVCGRTN